MAPVCVSTAPVVDNALSVLRTARRPVAGVIVNRWRRQAPRARFNRQQR